MQREVSKRLDDMFATTKLTVDDFGEEVFKGIRDMPTEYAMIAINVFQLRYSDKIRNPTNYMMSIIWVSSIFL